VHPQGALRFQDPELGMCVNRALRWVGAGSSILGRRAYRRVGIVGRERQNHCFDVEGFPTFETWLKLANINIFQNLAVSCTAGCRRLFRLSLQSEGGSRNLPARIRQAADYAFGYNPPYDLKGSDPGKRRMDQVRDWIRDLVRGAPLLVLFAIIIVPLVRATVREFRGGHARAVRKSDGKISLSHRVYFVVPPIDIVLMSIRLEGTESFRLSMRDARELFKMLKLCCEMQQLQEAEIGGLFWKIDGRINWLHQKTMVVQLSSLGGLTREVLDRATVMAAVTQFFDEFGL